MRFLLAMRFAGISAEIRRDGKAVGTGIFAFTVPVAML